MNKHGERYYRSALCGKQTLNRFLCWGINTRQRSNHLLEIIQSVYNLLHNVTYMAQCHATKKNLGQYTQSERLEWWLVVLLSCFTEKCLTCGKDPSVFVCTVVESLWCSPFYWDLFHASSCWIHAFLFNAWHAKITDLHHTLLSYQTVPCCQVPAGGRERKSVIDRP